MKNFKKLNCWKNAVQISKLIYSITSDLPSIERYGIQSQLRRASISISSNIAEGASRSSKKDFRRFLEIALGSCFEIESILEVSGELELIEQTPHLSLLLTNEEKMLHGLIAKLSREIQLK